MDIVGKAKVPTKFKGKADGADWAIETLKAKGFEVDKQGFGTVVFSEKDIRNGVKYADTDAEKAAFAVLPNVLKRGIIIEGHNNHKIRTKQTVTIAAPVEHNGTRGNMGVVVNRHGNRYYAHRILLPGGSKFVFSEIKEEAERESYQGVTEDSSLADTTSFASINKVPQKKEKVKNNLSMQADQTDIIEKGTAPQTLLAVVSEKNRQQLLL